MNTCPLCNWKIYKNKCSNPCGCKYTGTGYTKEQIKLDSVGHTLGGSIYENDSGANTYTADTEFWN